MDRTGRSLRVGDVVAILGLSRKIDKGILTVEITTQQMVISQMDYDMRTGAGVLVGAYFNGGMHQFEFKLNERIPELLKVADTVGDF